MLRIHLALGHRHRHLHRHRIWPVYREPATSEFPGFLVGQYSNPNKKVVSSVSNAVTVPVQQSIFGTLGGPSTTISLHAGVSKLCVLQTMSSKLADTSEKCQVTFVTQSGVPKISVSQTMSSQLADTSKKCQVPSVTQSGTAPVQQSIFGTLGRPSRCISLHAGVPKICVSQTMSSQLADTPKKSGCLVGLESNPVVGRFAVPKKKVVSSVSNAVTAPVQQSIFGTLGGPSRSISLLAGAHMDFHSHSMYGTLADNERNSGIISMSNSGSYEQLPNKVEIGDNTAFKERMSAEMDRIKDNISGFRDRYLKCVRPILASRCLIAPAGLDHPSTVFLHRQTNKILKHDPRYLSVFDIMSYEDGVDSLEWKLFLEHLTRRRVYIIEDENIDIEDEATEGKDKNDENKDKKDEAKKHLKLSMSSIETLLYDHGIKGVHDDNDVEFYKGECDASFAKDKVCLSYIIWKGDTIVFSETYQNIDIECESPTEAEVFAAFALLSKARDLGIQKLLICSDCDAITRILSGQLILDKSYPHLHRYLMLRSMRRHFKKLVATWKPRELMAFVDDVGKVDSDDFRSLLFKNLKQRWSTHLKGLPVFRIEWAESTQKTIRKTFAKTYVDESFGTNSNSEYFVGVEENGKLDCLIGLKQSFQPSNLVLYVHAIEEKSPDFITDLKKLVGVHIEKKSGCYTCLAAEHNPNDDVRTVVVVFDAVIPKEYYYNDDAAIHVLFATEKEMRIIKENNIPRLTALAFVYFNGVQFPLNDHFKKKNGDETKEKLEQKMEDWKDSDKKSVCGEEEGSQAV